MLSKYLMISWLITICLGFILTFITERCKFSSKKKRKFLIVTIVSYVLSIIFIIGAWGEYEIAKKESSTAYYYEMLEHKTYIEAQLKTHEKEIAALKTNQVDDIPFAYRNEIINLKNTIERYNNEILQQKKYKDSYLFRDRYNEAVANLNTFEEIF